MEPGVPFPVKGSRHILLMVAWGPTLSSPHTHYGCESFMAPKLRQAPLLPVWQSGIFHFIKGHKMILNFYHFLCVYELEFF